MMMGRVHEQKQYSLSALNARNAGYKKVKKLNTLESGVSKGINRKAVEIKFPTWTINRLELVIENMESTISAPNPCLCDVPILSVIRNEITVDIKKGSIGLFDKIYLIGDRTVVETRILKIALLHSGKVTSSHFAGMGDRAILTCYVPFRYISHLRNLRRICKVYSVFDN